MSSRPPPPPPPGQENQAQQANTAYLDRLLREVCKRQQGIDPLECYSPGSGRRWPGGRVTLRGEDNGAVDLRTAESLMTALFAEGLAGTAFPERTTEHAVGDYCVLCAVNCLGLTGFDTEACQLSMPGSRQWRPGEKAFASIPPSRLIGYVTIRRRGAEEGGGWNAAFDFVT